jgi:DNA-binding winged helix-turn-helix (wHTH) protein/Tol biopolymer transport system component
MATPAPVRSRIHFGAFDLDVNSGELRKAGVPIKLRYQAMEVLIMLTKRPGQVVTREEIRERLWSDDTFVDFERSINFCINQIRTALNDDAENPRYVETLPKRGYRFIAAVTPEASRLPAQILAIAPALGESVVTPAGVTSAISASSEMQVVTSKPARVRWLRKHYRMLGAAFVVASITVVFGTQRWIWSTGPVRQLIKITALTKSGAVTDVAIAPDGRYVAYARRQGDREGLWLNELSKNTEMQVVANGTSFHGLTFSRDGNKIYFVRSDEKDPFFKYLYSVPIFGGQVQKLITDVDSPVSFSPDGRQFVYEHCIQPRNDIELKVANTNGGEERLLTTIHDGSGFLFQPGPNWSPDGRTIAVPVLIANQRLRWVLDIVSVSDGSIRELYSSQEVLGRPVWLSGGRALMFPRFDETARKFQLWTISFPQARAQQFTHDLSDYGIALDMTRDGHLFTTTAATTTSHIWIAPAADLSQSQQVTSGALSMVEIAEAADGKLLARGVDGLMWMMHTDGSQQVRFSELQRISWPASCGRYVILLANEGDTRALIRVDRDGAHPMTLVRGNLWSPACSADGNVVFYATFDQPQKFWKVSMFGGMPQYVSDVPGDSISGRLALSPDGKLLAYPYTQFGRVPSEGWKIAVMPATGGRLLRQFEVPTGFRGVRWSPSGTSLQYVLNENGADNVWEQFLTGGKPKQLTRFATDDIFDFSWSLDGTRLLLTRGYVNSNAVLLSDLVGRM